MKTQIAGITMVCDLAGFGFKHLRYSYSRRTGCKSDPEQQITRLKLYIYEKYVSKQLISLL